MAAPLNGRPGAPRPRVLPWGGLAFPAEGAGPGRRLRPLLPPPASPSAPLPISPPRLPGLPPPDPGNCFFEVLAGVAAPGAPPPRARGCRPAVRFQLLFILFFSTLLKPARYPRPQFCAAGPLAGGAGLGRGHGGAGPPVRVGRGQCWGRGGAGAGRGLSSPEMPRPSPNSHLSGRVGAQSRGPNGTRQPSQDSLCASSARSRCSGPLGCVFLVSVRVERMKGEGGRKFPELLGTVPPSTAAQSPWMGSPASEVVLGSSGGG